MRITIMFDKKSTKWNYDLEYNKQFVRYQQMYITDRYKCQGYIYLNTIYEVLGLAWNPHDENICWIYERDGELEMSIFVSDDFLNKIDIDILHNA